jgi:hypothetical protein
MGNNIKKEALKKYFDRKINSLYAVESKKENALAESYAKEFVFKHVTTPKVLEALEGQAQQLLKSLTSMRERIDYTSSAIDQALYKVREVTGYEDRIVKGYKSLYLNNAKKMNKDLVDKTILVDSIMEFRKEAKQIDIKRKEIETLALEIQSVIKVAPNGNKAYIALKEMGVDMLEFDLNNETGSNLPAVQKFSVSPEILKGDKQ